MLQAQTLGHPHEVGERGSPHLLHDAAAMDFDRRLGGAQAIADELVEQPGGDECEYLAFAGRQRFVT